MNLSEIAISSQAPHRRPPLTPACPQYKKPSNQAGILFPNPVSMLSAIT